MSHSSDRYCAVLGAEGVGLGRWHKNHHQWLGSCAFSSDATQPAWDAAVDVLAALLAEHAVRGAQLRVLLSARYIAAGEIEWWEKNNDPLDRYERYLLECNLATKEQLDEIVAGIQREIDEDCAWAESSPMPEGEQATYGVFDNNVVPPAFRPKVLEG